MRARLFGGSTTMRFAFLGVLSLLLTANAGAAVNDRQACQTGDQPACARIGRLKMIGALNPDGTKNTEALVAACADALHPQDGGSAVLRDVSLACGQLFDPAVDADWQIVEHLEGSDRFTLLALSYAKTYCPRLASPVSGCRGRKAATFDRWTQRQVRGALDALADAALRLELTPEHAGELAPGFHELWDTYLGPHGLVLSCGFAVNQWALAKEGQAAPADIWLKVAKISHECGGLFSDPVNHAWAMFSAPERGGDRYGRLARAYAQEYCPFAVTPTQGCKGRRPDPAALTGRKAPAALIALNQAALVKEVGIERAKELVAEMNSFLSSHWDGIPGRGGQRLPLGGILGGSLQPSRILGGDDLTPAKGQ